MSLHLHCLPATLLPPPQITRIPHLLVALTSKCAARQCLPTCQSPKCRHASTSKSPSPSSKIPRLPRRPLPITSPGAPTPTRSPKPYLWAISLFGATIGLYLSYYYASYTASLRRSQELHLEQNADVSNRWDDVDRDYDEEIEFSEKAMFMGRKRRRLVGGDLVTGKVLEVSCGTGRNFGWYDFEKRGEGEIKELLFNDQSAVMLGVARGKWEALQRERKREGREFKGRVRGVVGDAGIQGVIKRPEGGFDTIVQTMGVCSMQDPVSFLRHMGYLVRQPGERSEQGGNKDPMDKGGRILLLEHGRSYYDWINRLLDQGAGMHADRYGCWYNKDVGEVVRRSGLVVERVRRYHLGTTWEVVLRPKARAGGDEVKRGDGDGVKDEVLRRKKSWWAW